MKQKLTDRLDGLLVLALMTAVLMNAVSPLYSVYNELTQDFNIFARLGGLMSFTGILMALEVFIMDTLFKHKENDEKKPFSLDFD